MPSNIVRPTGKPVLVPPVPARAASVNLADLPRIVPPSSTAGSIYHIGTALFDRSIPVGFSTAYTDVHMAVLGESGSGKSKFLELYNRYLLLDGEGGALFDPDNDLADAVLSFVSYRYKIGDEGMARRCHVLTIGETLAYRLDVYADLPHRSAVSRWDYDAQLLTRAERLQRQVLRLVPGTDVEIMTRMMKRMKAAFAAAGVDYDGRGRYLGFDKALALANPDHPSFRRYLEIAFPHLPASVQATFREIMAERLTGSAKDHWESTQNRLDRVLAPMAELCLSAGPSIDFRSIIRNREFVIVRGRPSKRLSPTAAVTLNGLLIDAVLQAKEEDDEVPEHLRVPFTLMIDEVGDYLAEDLCAALRKDRKLKLRIIPCAQNYMTMCNGNVDLGDYVLSQCGTIVCFAQRMRKSREPVADRMFTGNIALTKEMHEVSRQRGFLAIQTPSVGWSGGKTQGRADGSNWGQTEADIASKSVATGTVSNWSNTENEAEGRGDGVGSAEGDVAGSSRGLSYAPILMNGIVIGNAPTYSTGGTASASRQSSKTSTQTSQRGRAHSEGGATTRVVGAIAGHSLARMEGGSHTDNHSETAGWSLGLNTSLVANTVSEYEWTGRYLEGSAADQREMHQRWLHVLNTAECFLSVLGCPFAFPVKINHVEELWASPALKWHATHIITRTIAAQHGYTFSPATLSPDATVREVGGRECADDEENPIA